MGLVSALSASVMVVFYLFYCAYSSRISSPFAPKPKVPERPRSRSPDAIIIGVKKGGTRAMIAMLNLHPRVIAALSEIHYFDREENFAQGLQWYLAQLPKAKSSQLLMEKSPAYFVTPAVPMRIYRLSPKMRLILLLRNPIDRIVSDFMQGLHRKNGQAIRLSDLSAAQLRQYQRDFRRRVTFRNGSLKASVGLVRIGLYAKHLQRWLKAFPRRQLFIACSEDFVSNPISVLRKAEHFLGIDKPTKFPWEQHVVPNPKNRKFFCLRSQSDSSAKIANSGSLKCLDDTKGRDHIPLPPDLENKLYKFFAPQNEELFKLMGQKCNWSKER